MEKEASIVPGLSQYFRATRGKLIGPFQYCGIFYEVNPKTAQSPLAAPGYVLHIWFLLKEAARVAEMRK